MSETQVPVEKGQRNVDIQPTSAYEDAQNEAANAWVKEDASYSGSVEALALKQAFVVGADTSGEFEERFVKLFTAFRAGRKWGQAPKGMSPDPGYLTERGRAVRDPKPMGNRRLVAVGRKRAEYHTQEVRIDNHSQMAATAHDLIPWTPQSKPERFRTVDHDERRKQRIEDAIVRGDDL